VGINVHELETADWTKDEAKKDFEESSAQEKVKKTEVPKALGWIRWLARSQGWSAEKSPAALKTVVTPRPLLDRRYFLLAAL
jgi:hypothetical protein